MSALLSQAIANLNLQPGQTIRTVVDGHEVEVRMLKAAASIPPVEPTPLADMVMLEPWFSMPEMPTARVVTVQRGNPSFPSPIKIDESDLAPE